MTLVVALAGKDEIIIAAERLCLLGDTDGQYRSDISKIREMKGGITAGIAGARSGLTLLERANELTENNASSKRKLIDAYAAKLAELYGRSYDEIKFLLCAVENSQPLLYIFGFNRQATFLPAEVTEGRVAVGLSKHGALHFLHTYHSRQMNTKELAFLAYFSIHQAIRNDPRLKGPIDVYAIRSDSATQLQRETIDAIRAKCETTETAIGDTIRKVSLELPTLIFDSQ